MATHVKKHIKNRGNKRDKQLYTRDEAEGEHYAEIINPKGDYRFEVKLNNNQQVIAKARGAIISGPNKQRLLKGDIVLVQQNMDVTSGDKYYILCKYDATQIRQLYKMGELTEDENEIKFDADVRDAAEAVTFDSDFINNI
jgi:translation initiation factor IF-1